MRALLALLATALAATPLTMQAPTPAAGTDRRSPLVARADKAIAELQSTLLARLETELSAGGVHTAVSVCRDEAQAMTAAIGRKHRVLIGRTSDRVRNTANAPRPWAAAHVSTLAGAKAADAAPAVVDLEGGGVGVLRPIGTIEFCVMCHGDGDAVHAAIGPVLAEAYPDDRAVGFAAGDLRGWFWAEAR